jgi:hypothetical protein
LPDFPARGCGSNKSPNSCNCETHKIEEFHKPGQDVIGPDKMGRLPLLASFRSSDGCAIKLDWPL